ncbi:DUF1295 domain-containing protein [Shewanella youngdeokensis]|uniref:DUF1295 domain-containing protein n=1 Tax=Shewanella youngdeokensis TaxID=2999068 RepID=A0ABZ0K2Y5_9GAMM|nr:DUF1295 domain-containing protein [Shewanella sp. DAU334]
MKYFTPLMLFIVGWLVIMLTDSLSQIGLFNGLLQLVLFTFVVCIPTWRTGRMSYVDIGWPWGLTLVGLLTWYFAEGNSIRVAVVSIAYIFAGSRMGLSALNMWRCGHLDTELPRYTYQQRRWQKAGKTNTALAMQVEAIIQGLANASFLALPAFIIATNTASSISIFEIIGIVIWFGAFAMETIADVQKVTFLREMQRLNLKNKVCNVGLWRYSRHPNYFAEWMVWNGLVIAAIPSWITLYQQESFVLWLLLGVSILLTSRLMYTT